MADTFKSILAIIIIIFLAGFVFNILFKIGILALLVLGVIYMYNKVFGN